MRSRQGSAVTKIKKTVCIILTAMTVLLTDDVMPVYAINQTARLRSCLEEECLYEAVSIGFFNSEIKSGGEAFREGYEDDYYALSGNVKVESISGNGKEMTVTDQNGEKCTVDISAASVKTTVSGLSSGDEVCVYGKLNVKGFNNDSYVIEAKEITKGSASRLNPGSYVYPTGEKYDGKIVDDIALGGKVKYHLPETWDREYVTTPLTNNGINGHQYFLNAVEPVNTTYPEIFYIFWFDKETYLEQPPKDATDIINKDIECEIVKNIVSDKDNKAKIKVDDFENANGTRLHYCLLTYRGEDKNDYRLEFIFKPKRDGIVCMLYLYYPRETEVRHVRDVAYLIETMTIE